MAKIAMFGTGMMGSGMVERWLAQGNQVQVWNRTIEKARRLEKLGAKVLEDPVAAAQGVETIHIILSDDAAVDALLDRILDRIPKDTPVIDHTTVNPRGTAARAECAKRARIGFVHAPVFMSPQACRDGSGVMLASSPESVFKKVEDELKRMTGELWYLGERPDKAAAFKLFGNEVIVFLTAALSEMYALAKSVGIDPREAHELFAHFRPTAAIDVRGKKMANGDFSSSFDLTMARKDVGLMLETASAGGAKLGILEEIGQRMDELIAEGYGERDVGVLAIDAVGEPAGSR